MPNVAWSMEEKANRKFMESSMNRYAKGKSATKGAWDKNHQPYKPHDPRLRSLQNFAAELVPRVRIQEYEGTINMIPRYRSIISPKKDDRKDASPVKAPKPTKYDSRQNIRFPKEINNNPSPRRSPTKSHGPFSSNRSVGNSKSGQAPVGLWAPVSRPTQRQSTRRLNIKGPHRVFPPPFMHTPARSDPPFGVTPVPLSKQHKILVKDKLKDWQQRAYACHRAGRTRSEANAFFSMGILYDSIRNYSKAIQCYQKFREVLKSSEDQYAEALAHNSIGVSYQYLGKYDEAIYHHECHESMADLPGQFIACSNLGCVWLEVGRPDEARRYHDQALNIATKLNSVTAQTTALANIGSATAAALAQNAASPKRKEVTERKVVDSDRDQKQSQRSMGADEGLDQENLLKQVRSAKASLAQHIEMGGDSGWAWRQLGHLAVAEGDHSEASAYFGKAVRVGRRERNRNAHVQPIDRLKDGGVSAKQTKQNISEELHLARMHMGISVTNQNLDALMQRAAVVLSTPSDVLEQQDNSQRQRATQNDERF